MRFGIFFLTLFFCSFCSCNAIIGKFYGINKPMNLQSREEYIRFIEDKKKIDRSYILLPDSGTYNLFMDHVYGDRLGYYYGTYLNDSLAIIRSKELNENMTCMGRVLANMKLGLDHMRPGKDSLIEPAQFNQFKFYEAGSGNTYQIEKSEKPIKIYLLFYFSSGRLFDKSYKEIFRFAEENRDSVELRVITTDRISVFAKG